MTTMELMRALQEHATGLRTPDVKVYDTSGNEFEIVLIYSEDDYTCIDIQRTEED